MGTEHPGLPATDRLLKGFAVLLAVPVLGLGLWLFAFIGSFAGSIVAPGVSLWWRLLMLGTILIPVSAGFGLVQALSNRWVPAGGWFVLMGLGAAFWGPPGQLFALASAGLGIAMLIRGVESQPRWSRRLPFRAVRSSLPFWNRGFAIAAVPVAALSAIFGITGMRTGYAMFSHPDADAVMYLSLGVMTLPLIGAILLWVDRRPPAVLCNVLAAAAAFALPNYLDLWPYPVAPGSPEAALMIKMQVLGPVLLGFAMIGFATALLGERSRPEALSSAPIAKAPIETKHASLGAGQWTRSVVSVFAVILALGGVSYGLKAYSRERGIERVDELEAELRTQAQTCAASAADAVPYEPEDKRPLFSKSFDDCMREFEPNRTCSLGLIQNPSCSINTGGMSGNPPSRTIDVREYVDAALMAKSADVYDRPGDKVYGQIDQDTIPLPAARLTGDSARSLSEVATIKEAIRMKGKAMWIRGVLVAQPQLDHDVLLCPQPEVRWVRSENSINCSFGLILQDGVTWTDAERSFSGVIRDGAPTIRRWKTRGAEQMRDCVFDGHFGEVTGLRLASCSELESRYEPALNFYTLYSEVYGTVVGKPRDMWSDPFLADSPLKRNLGFLLAPALPGGAR